MHVYVKRALCSPTKRTDANYTHSRTRVQLGIWGALELDTKSLDNEELVRRMNNSIEEERCTQEKVRTNNHPKRMGK